MITLQRLLMLAALAAIIFSGPALADRLPRPAGLEPAVEFWQRVYTELSVSEGVIHDSGHALTVVGRIGIEPPPNWQARRDTVRAALKRYRAGLNALADQGMQPADDFQSRLLTRLPAGTEADEARQLAQRLRFQGGLRERFREGLVRSGRWRAHIREVLEAHGVPPALVALPHVESSFDPRARSHAGAAGLWQFTSGTGRRFLRIDPVLDERLDPWASTRAAAELLAHNYAEIGSWPLAITAYNHGLNGMRRAVREVGSRDYLTIQRNYTGRYFGFASRNFYPALLAAADVDANAQRYFDDLRKDPPLEPVRVALPYYTPLETLLEGVAVDEATLQRLNPALGPAVWDGRKFIPGGYALALPAAGAGDWSEAVAALPGTRLYRDQRPDVAHRVVPGDTLSQIARRYDVSLQDLIAHNGIHDPRRLQAGQRLRLPMAGGMPEAVGGRHYEVRPGDTLGAIAMRHGVETRQLVQLNELDNPDRLRVGQRLLLGQGPQVAVVDTATVP
ncbi:lytic transglycosylase domain-containing protein [Spiribacter insolitus]|uniref:LysM peptidoglycan-binding domain-containing protein n=1 Tax=Spiribacter insolitus TaxID=3122417 RepID=A0ABV3T4M4_9GAMM